MSRCLRDGPHKGRCSSSLHLCHPRCIAVGHYRQAPHFPSCEVCPLPHLGRHILFYGRRYCAAIKPAKHREDSIDLSGISIKPFEFLVLLDSESELLLPDQFHHAFCLLQSFFLSRRPFRALLMNPLRQLPCPSCLLICLPL
jgi:hypothetical protein